VIFERFAGLELRHLGCFDFDCCASAWVRANRKMRLKKDGLMFSDLVKSFLEV
jgi:hypothetical protein